MNFNRRKFFDQYRRLFGSLTAEAVAGLEFLLGRFEKDNWTDARLIAYCLATVKIETAHTFLPITERGERAYFNKYEWRKTLGNKETGDGYKYRGRGFSQITGRKNHQTFSDLLGIDLINKPEKALEPNVAFDILAIGMLRGLFTGKRLPDYINSVKTDYKGARKTVNGTDKAEQIADYAEKFEKILKSSLSTNFGSENSREFNTHTPLNEVVEKSGDGRGLSDELKDAENPAAPPESSTQTADQITNISSGEKTVPDNFTSETKVMDAPAATGITAKLGKWTAYLGLGVPTMAGIGSAVKGLYADGTISPADIFSVISSVFKYVLPYSSYIVFGLIGYKIVKTALVQVSFMLRMYLNASADKHDIQIAVKEEAK